MAGQHCVLPGTLPNGSRKFSNGPMLPIASLFGPLNSRRPNIIAFKGPQSPRPLSFVTQPESTSCSASTASRFQARHAACAHSADISAGAPLDRPGGQKMPGISRRVRLQ